MLYVLFTAPLKVVYADGEHTLFYTCYMGNTNESCIQQAMEVTLVGKSLEISQEKRDSIYSILPSNCFNPADMKQTEIIGK